MDKKVKPVLIENKFQWEKWMKSNNPATFLQSWNWGETNAKMGDEVVRYIFYKGSLPVASFQGIIQKAKRGKHILIPGGPVMDWNDQKLIEIVVSFIKKIAIEKNVKFVRIRPDIENSEIINKIFKNNSFIPSPMHLHAENTWILDLSADEDTILSNMRKTTRYCIKKSLNEGLTIEKTTDSKSVDILYKLQKETSKRHSFVEFPKKLFKYQLETFGEDGGAVMYICRKNKEVLVAAMILYYGETAFYHHSASSNSARNTNASYFLQWNIIKDAKKLGCKYYNFWGIAPENKPKHRFFGVTVFKKGFGGYPLNWVHAHDIIISKIYWLTYLFEYARRIKRRLY